MIRKTFEATEPRHQPWFTGEELAQIIGLPDPHRVEFKTPNGQGVHIYKVEITYGATGAVVLYAYN